MSDAPSAERSSADELLDVVAARVFGTPEGVARIEPLLDRFRDEVGILRDDDEFPELLQAIRTDWALCDAPAELGATPGDTWWARALGGAVPGVDLSDLELGSGAYVVGLFEVWPGSRAWLRDPLRGYSLELLDELLLEPTEPGGPAALWECRVWLEDGVGRLCRAPLPYPLEIRRLLLDAARLRWERGGPPVSLLRLRRLWLHFHRAPRADATAVFSGLLR